MPKTISLRLEQVLLSIAEDTDAPIAKRLDATAQLAQLIKVKPGPRAKRQPRPNQIKPANRAPSILGSDLPDTE